MSSITFAIITSTLSRLQAQTASRTLQEGLRLPIIDITHGFSQGMPSYPADWYPEFSYEWAMTPETDPSKKDRHFSFLHLFPHNATHIESSLHFYPGGKSIDEVPVECFTGRACIAHLPGKGELAPVTADDLDQTVGEVWSPGDRLLVRTDYLHLNWGRPDYWDRPPYLTPDAAQWAVDHQASLVGLDCLTERPGDQESPVHRRLLSADIPILEYITNLHLVPMKVVQLIALPIKVHGVEAAPARAIVTFDAG